MNVWFKDEDYESHALMLHALLHLIVSNEKKGWAIDTFAGTEDTGKNTNEIRIRLKKVEMENLPEYPAAEPVPVSLTDGDIIGDQYIYIFTFGLKRLVDNMTFVGRFTMTLAAGSDETANILLLKNWEAFELLEIESLKIPLKNP